MGTLSDPVPVTGLAENFSPIPRIAPPPLGSDMGGRAELPSPTACGAPALSPRCPDGGICAPKGCCGLVSGRSPPDTTLFRTLSRGYSSQLVDQTAMNSE